MELDFVRRQRLRGEGTALRRLRVTEIVSGNRSGGRRWLLCHIQTNPWAVWIRRRTLARQPDRWTLTCPCQTRPRHRVDREGGVRGCREIVGEPKTLSLTLSPPPALLPRCRRPPLLFRFRSPCAPSRPLPVQLPLTGTIILYFSAPHPIRGDPPRPSNPSRVPHFRTCRPRSLLLMPPRRSPAPTTTIARPLHHPMVCLNCENTPLKYLCAAGTRYTQI
mmetsp:Transcript_27063/g.54095  ORF Transcript_27063/g.54095 Transcript_27063/m.54095 type:complete len:220 (-) Transcript_27063:1224-1883(-)